MFFLSPRVLQGPSADRRETLPVDGKVAEFYNAIPKIAPPPEKNGGQNKQNFGRFFATSDFDLEYLGNYSRVKISKIGKLMFPDRFLLLSRK